MALVVKNPLAEAGDIRDAGSIPGSGRSHGEGHGYPLQCSCLENPMDRGPWRAAVHRVAKSRTGLKWLSTWTWSQLKLNGKMAALSTELFLRKHSEKEGYKGKEHNLGIKGSSLLCKSFLGWSCSLYLTGHFLSSLRKKNLLFIDTKEDWMKEWKGEISSHYILSLTNNQRRKKPLTIICDYDFSYNA